jgi:AraC-like DNA-binding protein
MMPLFTILEKSGINVHKFLSSEGIDPRITQSPDSRLSLAAVHTLTEKAARMTGDENIGLHEGEVFAGFSNILGYILMSCATVGEAIEKYCVYQKITDEGRFIKLQAKGSYAIVEVVVLNDALAKERHLIDHMLSGFLTYSKLLTRREISTSDLIEVRFAYKAPDDLSEYRRIFPCKLVFGSPMNALVFNSATLDTPIPQRNKDLLTVFEQYAVELLAKLTEADSYTNRVSRIIIKLLRGETPTIEEVARELAMSVRNLQLKLKEEGTTYSAILDEIRRDLAMHYLKDREVPIAEISYLLGFSEPSVFHRCFKKWTNSTPAKFRVMNA